MVSPGYEARAAKALEMLRMVHGDDIHHPNSPQACDDDYKVCHELLLNNNPADAIQKWKDMHNLK